MKNSYNSVGKQTHTINQILKMGRGTEQTLFFPKRHTDDQQGTGKMLKHYKSVLDPHEMSERELLYDSTYMQNVKKDELIEIEKENLAQFMRAGVCWGNGLVLNQTSAI